MRLCRGYVSKAAIDQSAAAPCCPNQCMTELTVTTREPGVSRSAGVSACTRAKWPMSETPNSKLKPSAVRCRRVAGTPALHTSAWSEVPKRWVKDFANASTLSSLERSSSIGTGATPVSASMSAAAAAALSLSRHARTTVAPIRASCEAVRFPRPVFDPVTMMTFPLRSTCVSTTFHRPRAERNGRMRKSRMAKGVAKQISGPILKASSTASMIDAACG